MSPAEKEGARAVILAQIPAGERCVANARDRLAKAEGRCAAGWTNGDRDAAFAAADYSKAQAELKALWDALGRYA
jgi:hypothetical protein